MHSYSGFAAAFICCTLLLAGRHASARSQSDDEVIKERKSFLMSLVQKLTEEAKMMTNDNDASELLADLTTETANSCPESLPPKCRSTRPSDDTNPPSYRWCTGIALDTTVSMEPEIDLTMAILSGHLQNALDVNPGTTSDDVVIPYCYALVEVRNHMSTCM